MLGLHVALRTASSRVSIVNTLGTVFFLSVGTLISIWLILISRDFSYQWASFIFSGILLGLLPMWNSAVFIAAGAVLAVLLILFPLRRQMFALGIAASILALPQILYLSTGAGRVPMPPLFHWGYTVDQPTFWSVVSYLAFSFGFKWVLLVLALIFGFPKSIRRAVLDARVVTSRYVLCA